jgi:hypothetical protein
VLVAWRERKLLWPDVLSRHPDILLSLGTGQHKSKMDQELKTLEKRQHVRKHESQTLVTRSEVKKNGRRFRAWNGIKNSFSVLVSAIPVPSYSVWNIGFDVDTTLIFAHVVSLRSPCNIGQQNR